ncbi:MBL fold metallo-hydrolase [candidate division KSB1 bacterium]|nr:MBL fold metallo-hydrolase [candidate division KSB1 bacterium]
MKRIPLMGLFVFLPHLLMAQVMNVYLKDGRVDQYQVSEIDSMNFASRVGTLTWIGHASVKIKTNDGIVVYIDPYAGTTSDYADSADIILVSHAHSDHNLVNKVTQKNSCNVFAGSTQMSAGDKTFIKGISIKAVQAYNSNHVKGFGVGFVIEFNGVKIYHSGDTSQIPEMEALAALNLDYAMLCIDGQYNMGPIEAMAVAEIIKARRLIPIHTGFTEQQKETNVANFTHPNRLIMREGDTIYL